MTWKLFKQIIVSSRKLLWLNLSRKRRSKEIKLRNLIKNMMNKANLRNYKSYLSAALVVVLLLSGFVLDLRNGFLGELISPLLYIAGGGVSGLLAYYIFLDDTTY